jgi:hypothetical protein
VLRDFEDYMLHARKGGSRSKMRPEDEDPDEDIRGTLVQKFLENIANESGK